MPSTHLPWAQAHSGEPRRPGPGFRARETGRRGGRPVARQVRGRAPSAALHASEPLTNDVSGTSLDLSSDFDLLVIGAGIIGSRVALEAAQAGLKVALVDAGDFGSLIHGGIRYLPMGDLRLVRENHLERRAMLDRVAPHLVWPLDFVIPVYGGRWPRSNSGVAWSCTRLCLASATAGPVWSAASARGLLSPN